MEKNLNKLYKAKKAARHKLIMLTAYDCPLANILDEAGVEIILVGDSLGNVILGHQDTHRVSMADMIHHTRAVAQGVKRAMLVSDVPYRAASHKNARRLVAAGAQAVKIEGTRDLRLIKQIIRAGIPVMGHLGYLPQSSAKPGLQRSETIVEQARQLEQAGVFALVLELVEPKLAQKVTKAVKIPTIGIGSGKECDGQVLVTYDLLGLSCWSPKFVKKILDLRALISKAIKKYLAP